MLIKAEEVFPATETRGIDSWQRKTDEEREREESEGGRQFGLLFQVSQGGLVGFL